MRIFNSEIVLGFTFQVVPQPKITSTKVAEAIEITENGKLTGLEDPIHRSIHFHYQLDFHFILHNKHQVLLKW